MKYATVIFDLDGTLADTLGDIARLMNRTLRGYGWPGHSTDAYRRFVGDGVHKLVERAIPAGEQLRVEEVVAKYLPLLTEEGVESAALYPGIDAMLDALTKHQVAMAVLSNKPDEATKAAVAKLMGRWKFALVHGQIAGEPPKPDPMVALRMAKQLNVEPRHVVFVGDSNVDMELAKNAGFVAVGAGWGFRGEQELRAHGAAYVIHEPMELMKMIQDHAG